MQPPPTDPPIRIGISQCLLGERVRYDGAHKHDHFLTDILGRYVQWVPVCPEVEIGLGTPREPIQLVQLKSTSAPLDIRLVGVESGADHTTAMRHYARRRAAALAKDDLCGYVLKADSPSCGMQRVKVHQVGGRIRRSGRGLFAAALLEELPNLPVEEEGRLRDPRLRENWIERVFAYRRLKDFWAQRWKIADLAAFHAAHELTLLAHSPHAFTELDQLVAKAEPLTRRQLRERYETAFMAALAKLAARARHASLLEHAAGYFRNQLDATARRELVSHIHDYRKGSVPLAVPLTLVSHYVHVFDIECLQAQSYLNPNPAELALASYV